MMMSLKHMKWYFLYLSFCLPLVRKIRSSGELTTEQSLSWGNKKARTMRYEVINTEKDKEPVKCAICRPKCPHWKSLNKCQRNTEKVRWTIKNY